MAVADTLLVTPAELLAYSRSEVAALEDVAPDGYGALVLAAAQASLASYLGYDPFVHRVVRFRPTWYVASGMPTTYEPFAALGPGGAVVQVDASEYEETPGTYTVTIAADGAVGYPVAVEVEASDPLPPALDVWAGWRSSNHTLDGAGGTVALTSLPGLADLEALPPLPPPDVRAALCHAALYLARYATQAGLSAQTVDLGAQVKTVETVAAMNDVNVLIGQTPEITAIYQRCHRHRRVTA